MLDGLLGRGFASKCKSSIKLTRTRIDAIRRKRNATQKFLKKDIADLLANGLDINAYGRAQGLLVELFLSSCYDFVEQCCECILKHLSVMQKQSECPEDCRVAVSTLMFAAARFSDLPELRDLRHIFQERYGNSLEYFVNQEFVKNLASKPPTMEKKVKLMQQIALEFSIRWDSKAFELRMSNPPASTPDQQKTYGALLADDRYKSPNGKDGRYKFPNGKEAVPKADKHDALTKERHELTNGRDCNMLKRDEMDSQFVGGQPITMSKHKPPKDRESTFLKTENHDISSRGRREISADQPELCDWKEETASRTVRLGSSSHGKRLECIDGGYKLPNGRDNTASKREDHDDPLSHGKPGFAPSAGKEIPFADINHDGQHNIANSIVKVEEETERIKAHYNTALPPPYIKSKRSKHCVNSGSKNAGFDCNGAPLDPSTHIRADAGSRPEGIQIGLDHPGHGRQVVGPARVNNHVQEEHQFQDDTTDSPMPKRRSARRRHLKSPSGHDDRGNIEDTGVARRNSSGRRRDKSRRGLQILFDDEHHQKDEEERMIDKLLLHYSKKPSTYDPEKVRQKFKADPSHDMATDAGEFQQNRSKDVPDVSSEMVPPPVRSVSLPREQKTPAEPTKVFTRASSFQPNMLSPAKHVHPKLPDYDDLAATFASLKAK